jgi:hypothetical protein
MNGARTVPRASPVGRAGPVPFGRRRPFPAGPGGLSSGWWPGAFAIAAGSGVVAIAAAVAGTAFASTDQLRRHARRVGNAGADDLDPLQLGPGAFLGRGHGHDGDALDLELGLGFEHVAGLGAMGEQVSLQDPPWLSGARGAPSPRAVRSPARQLDLDASGHTPTLPERGGARTVDCGSN